MSKDRVGSLFLLGVGIYALSLSLGFPMGTLAQIGSGPYPLAISILLCACAAIIFFTARSGTERIEIGFIDFVKTYKQPLQIILLTAGYILAFKRAGYLTVTIVYLFLLFFLVCRYKLAVSAALSVLFGIGSWYFFVEICGVTLPKGFLG